MRLLSGSDSPLVRALTGGVPSDDDASYLSPGLARNDSLVVPVLGAFLISGALLVNRQREIVGTYMQRRGDGLGVEPKTTPVPVANLPLRLVENGTDAHNFSQLAEREKEARESAVLELVRRIYELSETGYLKAGLRVELAGERSEAVKAQRKERLDALLGKKAPSSAGARGQVKQRAGEAWWLARYTLYSLFDKEVPETRYLPMSFVLGCTDVSSHEQFLFFGAVRRVVIESDVSLLEEQDAKNVAYKLIFDLVDTNWRNLGRMVGDPSRPEKMELVSREIRVVCTQDNTHKLVTAVVGADGKALNMFVSTFAFRLEDEPVRFADDSLRAFQKEGFGLEVNQSSAGVRSIRMVASMGRRLLFVLRALPVLFEEVKFRLTANRERDDVGQMFAQEFGCVSGPLPLEVVVRRAPGIHALVTKVVVRTTVPMRAAGDLDWDSNALMYVDLRLSDGRTLELSCRNCAWSVIMASGVRATLGDIASVDLVVLSALPRKSYRTPASALPSEGVPMSTTFQSKRFVNPVNLGLDAYERAHGSNPRLDVDSLEVSPATVSPKAKAKAKSPPGKAKSAATKSAATKSGAGAGVREFLAGVEATAWPGMREDPNFKLAASILGVLALAGLVAFFKPSGKLAFAAGVVARLAGIASLVAALVFAAATIGENPIRNQAEAMLGLAVVTFVASAFAVVLSLRCNTGVSATFFCASLMALACALVLYSMPLSKEVIRGPRGASANSASGEADGDAVQPLVNLEAVLLGVMGFSLFLVACEARKMGTKAYISCARVSQAGLTQASLPPIQWVPAPQSAGPAVVVFGLVVLAGLAYMLSKSRDTGCDRLRFLIERKKQAIQASRLVEGGPLRKQVLEDELEDLQAQHQAASCDSVVTRFGPRVIVGGLVLSLLGVFVVAPYSLSKLRKLFPSNVPKYVNPTIEDARQTPRMGMAKLAAGITLVAAAAYLLVPWMGGELFTSTRHMDLDRLEVGTCPLARQSLREFYRAFGRDANVYAYDSNEKLASIMQGFDSLGCASPEDIVVVSAIALFFVGWVVAYSLSGRQTVVSLVASPLQLVVMVLFCALVLVAYAWMWERRRGELFLNHDFTATLNQLARRLTPAL